MTELLTHANGTTAPPGTPPARDFSRKRTSLAFTIDDDTFVPATALPGDVYAELVTLYNKTGSVENYQEQHDLLKTALQLALLPDSYDRFTARLRDKTNPIDDDQMADVVLYLLEAYGLRPTQPSQPSSDGPSSPASGTSSTDEQQPQASTPPASPPTAS
ncbi:hypothetical protein P1S61_37395 [Streptomyces sp. ME08-AFT2]|uniref:hypothetical protein n=1 Tax=Streptomyces sp. ME08-AFT2 TaxID=3028683 RepID=UPI0029A546CB|nr:hypothetical protein [Streptomyces sp. ME08-AFT2]MDX3314632.1 hypothetical protein [Streptomyces sp. ME08-AFT2]